MLQKIMHMLDNVPEDYAICICYIVTTTYTHVAADYAHSAAAYYHVATVPAPTYYNSFWHGHLEFKHLWNTFQKSNPGKPHLCSYLTHCFKFS